MKNISIEVNTATLDYEVVVDGTVVYEHSSISVAKAYAETLIYNTRSADLATKQLHAYIETEKLK